MSKNQIVFLVVVLVILGVFVVKFEKPNSQPVTKNIDILTSTKNLPIESEEVSYFENAKGYFVKPQMEGTYPGVVLIHENRGLRPETKMAAEQLAKEGYLVLAVDLLGGIAETQDEAKVLTSNFSQEKGTANMRKAVEFLRQKGASKLGSLGWCFGGRQSVELAISGEKLDATVVYYGGNMATSIEKLNPIKWPVLGVFGDQDKAIPIEMVTTFRTSLDTLGVKNEIHIYKGVGHAFANPSGMNYAPTETKDAWDKTLKFLEGNLK